MSLVIESAQPVVDIWHDLPDTTARILSQWGKTKDNSGFNHSFDLTINALPHEDVVSLLQSLRSLQASEALSKQLEQTQRFFSPAPGEATDLQKNAQLALWHMRDSIARRYSYKDPKNNNRTLQVYDTPTVPIIEFQTPDIHLMPVTHGVSLWHPGDKKSIGGTHIRDGVFVLLESADGQVSAGVEVYASIQTEQYGKLKKAGIQKVPRAYMVYGNESFQPNQVVKELIDMGIVQKGGDIVKDRIDTERFSLVYRPDDMEVFVDLHDQTQYARIDLTSVFG
jgi:hypothetical protein